MKYVLTVAFLMLSMSCFADTVTDETEQLDAPQESAIISTASDDAIDTQCSTKIFADALANTAKPEMESEHETTIRAWIQNTFAAKQVLTDVLSCPEFASAADDDDIDLMPIQYTFPQGRQIVINYATQPKILKQRLTLADKRDLPSSDPNPRLSSADGTIWTNTDPAWYAIMVVEHGALNEFVGPEKNNTLSLQYISDNIDKLYPQGMTCTSKSALANDNYAINQAATKTVSIKDDTNDYYVAGDINLQWLTYLEVAADVVITVATFGAGTALSATTKAARASKALKGLNTTIKTLRNSQDVTQYIKTTQKASKLTKEIAALDKTKDAAKIADKTKDLDKLNDTIKTLESTDDVAKYKNATKTFSDLQAYRKSLQGMRIFHKPQRGNIFARTVRVLKGTKNAFRGNNLINRARKIGRASKFSTRAKDWLFNSTLKNIGILGKMQATTGAAYGAIKFLGDMYDWTETSTGEFTNNIEFSPLLLLSADDIQENGQENVVNHGMWLMWAGDSISAADDDAAYLQAMDFAAKFHEDLMDIQNDGNQPCNIDIFVVRPILRNPSQTDGQIYYLIMNDTPWTTAESTNE